VFVVSGSMVHSGSRQAACVCHAVGLIRRSPPARAQADKELPGTVVAKVLESMDVHGRLTLDQFLAIVEVWPPRDILSAAPCFCLCMATPAPHAANASAARLLRRRCRWDACA
jgi:hypothetical protein